MAGQELKVFCGEEKSVLEADSFKRGVKLKKKMMNKKVRR